MILLLLLAGRSALDLVRSGLGAEVGQRLGFPATAIAVLPLSLLAAILIGRQIRRQLSVWFDGFGIHYRRRVEARVLPWRTITGVILEPHWYGANIRLETETNRLTIVGGYYQSAGALLNFLESQVRFHAHIEAKLGATLRSL